MTLTFDQVEAAFIAGRLRGLTLRGAELGRICAGCGEWKPVGAFTVWLSQGHPCVKRRCLPCAAELRWRKYPASYRVRVYP